MLLRPYQATALEGVQSVYRSGRRRVLLVAPTGSGKSAMMRYMLGRTTKRTLILCHRAELRDMICGDLEVPYGVIGGNKSVPAERVHVGMMQTVSRRLATLPQYDWVISDEAHLAMCPTWRKILQHYDAAWHLGLSATPCRLDGQGLGGEYEQIVHGPSIRELTSRGYLAPCRVFAPSVAATVPRRGKSEINLSEAGAILDRSAITGDVIGHYRRIAGSRQAIVFCCSREHADNVAKQFRADGIAAVNVDGAMSDFERAGRIRAFRQRSVQVLVNVDLLTTGFDCPQIEVGIMLRPTQSLALFLQMVGRILRIFPGKEDAILLDHVGNVVQHGMPDAPREWTLEGRLLRKKPPPVRQCPKCYAAFAPAPKCPSCGYAFPAKEKAHVVAQRAGELAEVSDAEVRRLRESNLRELLKEARSLEQLKLIAKARGYDGRWVYHIMRARQARSGWAA